MYPIVSSFESYTKSYAESISKPEEFWEQIAQSHKWRSPWHTTLSYEFETPSIRWFEGATLNITENIFERHLETHADRPALIWEPNNPSEQYRIISYQELFEQVCQCANTLTRLGVTKGDTVTIYMPLIPEAVVTMLACARIGAIHSVVFAGFSAHALAERIQAAQSKIVVTADGAYREKKYLKTKEIVDTAIKEVGEVLQVLVVAHAGEPCSMFAGRDVWWHDTVLTSSSTHSATVCDSEDPLFVLYTSGSTGKPKGVVHSCGGYMVYAEYSFRTVFGYKPGDIFWCTADIGWITGHTYVVYGALLAGATSVLHAGTPTFPDASIWWKIIERHRVTQLYTAPTAIRTLKALGDDPLNGYDRSSLRILGTVGEPINNAAWEWYRNIVGEGRCDIVDTWWQTETGGIMISPIPGAAVQKPMYAATPLPGIYPVLLNDAGEEIHESNEEGYLCIKHPWPGMIRTTFGDHQRCRDTYFAKFPGYYYTGDSAKRDSNGYYRIIGRVDDVLNVSGHRIGTAELEDAINTHHQVFESAVIGIPDERTGTAICAFVVADGDNNNISDDIRAHVSTTIGSFAKPAFIYCVPGLPKTRSGKIMRRILRNIISGEGRDLGDTSTLLNPDVIEKIIRIVQV